MSQLIPMEQKMIRFNGADILGVKANDGKIYVGVKWICKGIGFDKNHSDAQVKKIQSDVVLNKGASNLTLPTNGGNQEVLTIELDFLPLWLAKISITPTMQSEQPEVAERLIEYQLKAKDALAQAFLPHERVLTQMEILATITQRMAQQEREEMERKRREAERDLEVKSLQAGFTTLTDNLTAVPDAAKIVDLINEYSRWTRMGHNEIYNRIYDIMKDQHGISVLERVHREREKINAERIQKTGRPYAESTLKKMVNGIDVMVRMGVLDKFYAILVGLLAKTKQERLFP
ncbi:phage antirepressor N-terminal domain-containing protein [Brevibacillus borstelensis]|uniref:phage antirepressor N-terminal domain-containing protein n=1 Tax=Brevibacillus borstelensis TaxID=45462 RepID=UPI000B305E3C|nr:phage antirepressor N-terminal domain-containing protein [Brevibacillus borstelensis]MED1881087.1 phage antirepressor N-terminal domain-containing protein [Brevibacillus borstelensis]GED53517.1 hypothetical protein BBO01nite_27580 [Brevibacillus borstelensis]